MGHTIFKPTSCAFSTETRREHGLKDTLDDDARPRGCPSHLVPALLEPRDDVADEAPLHAVGLDGQEGPLAIRSGGALDGQRVAPRRRVALVGRGGGHREREAGRARRAVLMERGLRHGLRTTARGIALARDVASEDQRDATRGDRTEAARDAVLRAAAAKAERDAANMVVVVVAKGLTTVLGPPDAGRTYST